MVVLSICSDKLLDLDIVDLVPTKRNSVLFPLGLRKF